MQAQPIRGFDPSPAMFPDHSRTRTFTRVDDTHVTKKTTWQQAIDEGACTLEEFIEELRRGMNEHYDKLENA
jgi:hypothetical protein